MVKMSFLHRHIRLFCATKRYLNTKCWKCGVEKQRRVLFCEKCNVIQNPDVKDNYFKVFDVEEKFDVDLGDLKNKFRKMQSVLHPDKFTTKTSEEKTISEEYSSLLNKAYNNLQLPISRAVHLLNLKGVSIKEDQKVTNPEFLMEIMEINESIDEANTPEKIEVVNTKNKKIMDEICQNIDNLFKKEDLIGAKEAIIKLKYFTSIHNRINNIKREKGIVD